MSPSVTLSDPSRALLGEHASQWLAAVAPRRSRRTYDALPAEDDVLDELAEFCDAWQPFPDARVVLARRPMLDVFTGIVGSYGKIVGAPHVLVFLGDERADFAESHVGFTGEAAVLEATRLGLSTCWVGGFFSARKVARIVELAPGERVYAVSPVGYAARQMRASEATMAGVSSARHRKAVHELAPDVRSGDWPAWAVSAVETARLAPSAVNRQPWRFRLEEGGSLVVSKDSSFEIPKVSKRLDIGIAMLHVQLAALAYGLDGAWTDLSGRDVARFDPTPSGSL